MSMRFRDPGIWFPAKRYGFGWGLPCAWQGWVILLVYLAAVIGGGCLVPDQLSPFAFLICVFHLTVAFLFVCWKKGEPLAWRWGGRD